MFVDRQIIEKIEAQIKFLFGSDHDLSEISENLFKLDPENLLLFSWTEKPTDIAVFFDHTLLKANAKTEEIEKLCFEAEEYSFHAVCVHPVHIKRCKKLLVDSQVKICAVIGFPLGANRTAAKIFEAKDAETCGADEIDMVINIGALKDNDLKYVASDIGEVVNSISKSTIVKVILETSYLTLAEKIKGSYLAKFSGADFVKTSTGFGSSGATFEDVALMRAVVGGRFGVKAAGGIRDAKTALFMIKAGANRIGASHSVQIVNEFNSQKHGLD